MSATRDEFRLMGFMSVYMVIQILAPLALIGLTVWAVNTPHIELTQWGPLLLAGLAAWAIWEIRTFVKWNGFTVTVTDEGITIGGRQVAWSDVQDVKVQVAIKLSPWVVIQPRSGDELRIPAAISKKEQLLVLLQKHHPQLVKS